MEVSVLVEPVANNGFSAMAGEPLPLRGGGATPEEALRNLRTALDHQLRSGKQLLTMDLAPTNPWLAVAGMHNPSDTLVQAWKREMATHRQVMEDDPDRP